MPNFTTLKIPGINGQSTIAGHEKTLEVMTLSYAMSIAVSTGMTNSERIVGRPNFSEINFQRVSDSATPLLMMACATGKIVAEDTVLTIARLDNNVVLPLFIFTLKDVVISNLSMSASGSDVPYESFSLSYSHIKIDYHVEATAGNDAGGTHFLFNVATNKSE